MGGHRADYGYSKEQCIAIPYLIHIKHVSTSEKCDRLSQQQLQSFF